MKIIFDFDDTLFNTTKFKSAFQQSFEELGITKELFFQTYNDSKKNQAYSPKTHFELIKKQRTKISVKRMEEMLGELLKGAPHFLYDDTVPFLEEWHKKVTLILLTFGNELFQKAKVKKSGIEDFFQGVFVAQNIKKIDILNKILEGEEKTFFVDDNFEDFLGVKENFPELTVIRVKRKRVKYFDMPDDPQINFSIKNLKELEKIVRF